VRDGDLSPNMCNLELFSDQAVILGEKYCTKTY